MSSTNISAGFLALGLLLFVRGINIIHNGVMRAVILGDERYYVGGFIAVVGFYLICVALSRWGK